MVVAGGRKGRGRGRPRKQLDDIKPGSDSEEEMMEHQGMDPASEISLCVFLYVCSMTVHTVAHCLELFLSSTRRNFYLQTRTRTRFR